jgi:hypothetical protein
LQSIAIAFLKIILLAVQALRKIDKPRNKVSFPAAQAGAHAS